MLRTRRRLGVLALVGLVAWGLGTSSAVALPPYSVGVSPTAVTLAPGESLTFTAADGRAWLYTWDFVTNLSGGTIHGASTRGVKGLYTAGVVGGVTDVIRVTNGGSSARATVTVTTLGVAPSSVALAPTASQAFRALGGTAPFTWAFVTDASGGTLSADGAYIAGVANDVTDVLRVTDSLGNSATAVVAVSSLIVSPSKVMLAPRANQTLIASGGSGTGYVWNFATNASGATLSTTGVYEAGANGEVTDVVRVTDSLGFSATAAMTVTAALSIFPTSVTLEPAQSQTFTASGGSGAYTWTLGTNASGGTVSASGEYSAGASGEATATDIVRVTDSLGVSVTATVAVTSALSISPRILTLGPQESLTFTASGGSGPYTWTLATNASGGTVSAGGYYTAGANANVTDVVQLTDSLGASTTAVVTVTSPLSISPPRVTLAPEASQAFTASGGSGPYTWALATNASGGTVTTSGEYTAGVESNVTDLVRVTDSLGANTKASVTVTSAGGCGAIGGGAFPMLALLLLPLLTSRRKTARARRGELSFEPSVQRGANHVLH